MSRIIDVDGQQSWRAKLVPANFRGIEFHIELGGVGSGRRVARHEFPKRNLPYAEDMGRKMRVWPIQGYLIVSPGNPDYVPQRDALIEALEQDGPGTLQHPTLGQELVMVESYTVTETREKGGFCQFDMVFVERGQPVQYDAQADTAAQVSQSSTDASVAASRSLDAILAGTNFSPATVATWNLGLGGQ